MGAGEPGRSYTYSYKLTVTVRDHGELKQSIGVIRVQEKVFVSGHTQQWLRPELCGEALPVKLRSGKILFALLNGPVLSVTRGRQQWGSAPTQVLLQGLKLPTEWAYGDDSGIKQLPDSRQPVSLGPNEMPEFVTFKDLNDPLSIMRVDPLRSENTLGDDVHLESVTVEATTASITQGSIAGYLSWFDPAREYLEGKRPTISGLGYHSSQFARCR